MDEFIKRLAAALKQDFGGFLDATDETWENTARYCANRMGVQELNADTGLFRLEERE